MILLGGAVNETSDDDFNRAKTEKLKKFLKIIKSNWGNEDKAKQHEITANILPDITTKQISDFIKVQQASSSPENTSQILKVFFETDISDFAKKVKYPTLIFHSMDDEFIPFSQSGLLATLIPDSKLILLDSRNHFLFENEPAWRDFLVESKSFLDVSVSRFEPPAKEQKIDSQATIPMEDARWEQVGEVFAEAMKLPADERRELLDRSMPKQLICAARSKP